MSVAGEVRFRLLRHGDVPATNPHNLAYKFGLQDTKQNILDGVRRPDGMIVFDFALPVKPGRDDRPVFRGWFASWTIVSSIYPGGRLSAAIGSTG